MKIEPFLFFDGQAEEAIGFYQQALGAKLESLMRYAECPDPIPPEYMPAGGPKSVLHSTISIHGARLMLADGVPQDGVGFRGFSLSLQYATEEPAQQAFAALAEAGDVIMPIGKTFFSSCYGIVSDRYGVRWMVMIEPKA